MDSLAILAGFFVGAIVGVTGVGGGALMTPFLILWLGVEPAVAIGTDLLYAAVTKVCGAIIHDRAGNVDRGLLGGLAVGSLPATLLVLVLLAQAGGGETDSLALSIPLGIALLLTALVLLARPFWLKLRHRRAQSGHRLHPGWVPGAGAFLGAMVSLTSIGAGALGLTLLMLLRPSLPTLQLIGTDLAHAAVLASVAGLGHAWLGHVDGSLLLTLLLGSLPGVWLGSRLSARLPEPLLRFALAVLLTATAGKLVFS